jgi:hypothetical protein
MLWPLLAVGLMYAIIGGGMVYNNNQRIIDFSKAYESNPAQFVESEKQRTEGFISWYPKTRCIFAAIAILGTILNIFVATPLGRSIGISFILMALATYMIDHFSEERAGVYYQKMIKKSESFKLNES